jgi:hypothetical protein
MTYTVRFNPETKHFEANGVPKPGINRILRAGGWLKDMPANLEAMERGKTIHSYIEMANLGTLDEKGSDPKGLAFVDQWRRFLDEVDARVYCDELGPFVERPLYSKRGDFCSALDVSIVMPKFKHPVVCNVKSSRNVYPHYRIQLAAEAVLMAANLRIRNPERLDRWGVHLDGSERRAKVELYDDPRDFEDWWHAVEVFHEQKKEIA